MLTHMNKAWAPLAVLTLAVALSSDATAGDKIAIKVGRIITQAGPDILNGVIVIENGKIRYIGTDPKEVRGEKGATEDVPWDAEVLEHPELTAFPGFVEAHSIRGMDRPNENIEVAPFLDVRDSIDPISFYFEDSLRAGITTINIQQGPACVIGGQGMVVKPFGLTIEQMLVKTSSGIKISAASRPGRSRATQAQALRRAFAELHQYLDKLVQDKKDGKDYARREALYQGRDLEKEENKKGRAMEGSATWKIAGLETIPRGEIDEKQEPLLRLVEGKIPAFIYCDSGVGVNLALEVARANGFLANTALVLEGDAWKAADLIAESGVPVILSPNLVYTERDPVTGKEIETFVPGVFKKKGVRFALQSLNTTTQSLWYQAALCMGYGLDRQTALDAVTKTSADILRLGKRVGSLEVGKDGNVLLVSGDPLSVTTTVNYVVLEGQLVYDRSKDVRTKHLIEGLEQPNAAPGGADAQAKPHDDDDEGAKDAKEEKPKKDAGEKKSSDKNGKGEKKDSGNKKE
jgi:imidazolonepropionase-like amidohydrolase